MAKTLPQDQYHIENCARFCADVEALITESNKKADERVAATGKPTSRLGYVEAVLTVAERRKIEPDLAAAYLTPEIKAKMQFEWESKHMLPKTARLPF
jgi:hypothetical protein